MGRSLAWLAGAALALLLHAPQVQANWLTRLVSTAEKTGSRAGHYGGTVAGMTARLKVLPLRANVHALAVAATTEGHWRFVNRAGETFTAGTPEELRRVVQVLVPEAGLDKGRLALYVDEETVFRHRASLKELPRDAEVHVWVGATVYPLVRQSTGAGGRTYVEVARHLLVEVTDRRLFDEALFQLGRRLDRSSIRVVALDPAGAGALKPAPPVDAAKAGIIIDVIEPARLHTALAGLRGQTVLVTGRVEGGLLHFKSAAGLEGSVNVKELVTSARNADANLIVIRTASARQPGGRNWLWQRIEVSDLGPALEREHLSDFLAALAGGRGRMVVTAKPRNLARTALSVTPADGVPGATEPGALGDTLAEVASELTGSLLTSGIEADVRSKDRQLELDGRILPGIPSNLQIFYLGLVGLGLFGLPVARRWWQWVWPPERRHEYGSAFAYRAGCLVRTVTMLFLFLPLAAPLSAPLQATASIKRFVLALWAVVTLTWRTLTWPVRRMMPGAGA